MTLQMIGFGYFSHTHCWQVYKIEHTAMHIARSIRKCSVEIGVEELSWSAQSLDLNPKEHLWDELESQVRARPNFPTSVPDLTNALVVE
jgi:hypothetical protein